MSKSQADSDRLPERKRKSTVSIMQTALHIFALTRELQSKISGGEFVDTAFYKKEREAYLFFQTEETTCALGLAYHPVGFGAFLIPRSKIEIDTREKPWPFFQPASGRKVLSVTQAGLDRILQIQLGNGAIEFTIVVEAIGPNGNLWLLDDKERIAASLRHKKFEPGQRYEIPSPPERMNPFEIDVSKFREALKHHQGQYLAALLRKSVAGLDEVLAGEILKRAEIAPDLLVDNLKESDAIRIVAIMKELAELFGKGDAGYLYEVDGKQGGYPFRLKSLHEEPRRFKTLSLAIYSAVRWGREAKETEEEKEKIIEAARRQVARIEKKIKKIEEDALRAQEFDELHKMAELLKINLVKMKKGMSAIELEDIYGTGKIKIPLNPALTPAENAEEYFKKYRKAKEGVELLGRRLEIARKELATAQKMLQELDADFEHAASVFESEIKEILPSQAKRPESAPRLPYKVFTLSSGVTIFVGRGGEDNDRTTFGHAKPYELWFHTAQCPGSHVVMKFPDKNFVPSKQEITEAAAVAAFHSKAKNAKAVPVIYTERRFVRKPRGAKPGLVTVEREKMVMVVPREGKG